MARRSTSQLAAFAQRPSVYDQLKDKRNHGPRAPAAKAPSLRAFANEVTEQPQYNELAVILPGVAIASWDQQPGEPDTVLPADAPTRSSVPVETVAARPDGAVTDVVSMSAPVSGEPARAVLDMTDERLLQDVRAIERGQPIRSFSEGPDHLMSELLTQMGVDRVRAQGGDPAPATPRPVFVLVGSVGRGGTNAKTDVLALKARMRALGYDWLPQTDTIDETTIQAIRLFQSIVNGRESIAGDGRVDVPGETYSWLQATNAPRWQLMPVGSAAEGYVNLERADTADSHDYGTNWQADTLAAASASYRDNYLKTHTSAALLTVNDTSLPHGGNTPDHAGHETGLSSDLRLPRTDGSAPGGTTYKTTTFDRDATRAMVTALRAQPLVSLIYFNDPTLIGEGLCTRADGHDDHLHVQIRPPVRGPAEMTTQPATGQSVGDWLPARAGQQLGLGGGSPLTSQALDRAWSACEQLRLSSTQATNPARAAAERIRTETGQVMDVNPYFGITRSELEAVIRAGYQSHQPPEVLLALWAKEGSTRSVTSFVPVSQATTETNAKTLFRSRVYYEDLGVDHFIDYSRPLPNQDNIWDDSDAAAPGHERHFAARVQDLVKAELLTEDISTKVNAELRIRRESNGTYSVQPTTTFYALSLLLMDALFTQMQRASYPHLPSISPALNYMQWNMGAKSFKTFLDSADQHRREPAYTVNGQLIALDAWALRTVPKANEWKQPRVNAMKFQHYVESYRPIFAPVMNLITPGIEDLTPVY